MKTAPYKHNLFIRLTSNLSLFAALLWISGCTQSTNPGSTGTSPTKADVRTFTAVNGSTVTGSSIFGKTPGIADHQVTADSVVITRARIVISSLLLHQVGTPDVDTIIIITGGGMGGEHGKGHGEGDKDKDEDQRDIITIIDRDDGTVRVGPFVAEFDASGEKIISEVTIPPGVYDKIKFQIHKLDDNDDPALLNDTLFGDFVNGGRYTFIIDGFAFVGGVAYPFEYKSSQTDNITLDITPPATFSKSTQYNLTLVFDPKIVFGQPGARPLDPRETDNRDAIEAMLRASIHLL
jgi:hypothetical protein